MAHKIMYKTASAFFMAVVMIGYPFASFAQQDAAGDQSDNVQPTVSQPVPKPYFSGIGVSMGSGKIVKLPAPAASIFAADPSVIEVRPASPTSLFVFGKGIGVTSIVATDSSGNTIAQYSVTVTPSSYAESRVSSQSQLVVPGSDVTAESEPGGMIVRGTVQTPDEANQIMNQAKIISPNGAINELQVNEPIQVELQVRIASMARSTTRQLGIDWSSVSGSAIAIGKFALTGTTGTSSPTISGTSPGSLGVTFPGGTLEGVIDALASDNLAHIVAEPTLTTLSGTQANFLVGGQFPIPISQSNGEVTVEFKTYGVQLQFTPTVFSNGRISLQVTPQISQISNANSVTLTSSSSSSSIVVPALTTEGVASTVILGSGQGMAIAGLLEDTTNQTDNAVPGIGEVPVLGALFRGDSMQREQQELVITVTPYLVNPVNNPSVLASPDDGWTPPNDLQRILLLRDNGTMPPGAAMPDAAGFVVQ
jgi:pilus assembly protein CpaC